MYDRPNILAVIQCSVLFVFFFFNDTATTEIYTLSLHDARPILKLSITNALWVGPTPRQKVVFKTGSSCRTRSEEHTSELQSQSNLVCRLLLEKKNTKNSALIMSIPPSSIRSASIATM